MSDDGLLAWLVSRVNNDRNPSVIEADRFDDSTGGAIGMETYLDDFESVDAVFQMVGNHE